MGVTMFRFIASVERLFGRIHRNLRHATISCLAALLCLLMMIGVVSASPPMTPAGPRIDPQNLDGDPIIYQAATIGDEANAEGGGATSRISIASDGTQGDGPSSVARISADSRYVVFSSQARNLVSGDTNNVYDIFVHDRDTGQTTRVSVTSAGGQGDGPSFVASISGDGRYVAFRSMAKNLVAGDTNNQDDVFLHDRDTRETVRISVGPGGVQGYGPSIKPVISADGKYVAFESWATNLVNGDNNGREDVFLYDRQARQVTRVSVVPGGVEANDESDLPAISADGRYVAFASQASNFVPGDNNNVCDTNNDGIFTDNCPDVFVYDRDTGQIERVSVGSGGTQALGWSAASSLSADGHYVAFESKAPDLVSGDNNGVYDIFVRDRQANQTWRVSVDSNGREGNGESVSPSISADGRYVAFVSRADNLVVGDTNGTADVFVHDRETRRTIRVSIATDGREGLDSSVSDNPALSANGRYVAFASLASNLVNGDTNGQMDVFVRDLAIGPGVAISVPLISGNDDAGVELDCMYAVDWHEIYFGRCTDGRSILSGFRFQNVPITRGVVISEAYLEITVDGTYANDIAVELLGEASASSAPFSDTYTPADRPLTAASANWNISASDVWSVGQSRRSPNLAAVVQEIIDLPDWGSGNALTIIARANPAIAGNAHRRMFAWEREQNSAHAARLIVIYRDTHSPPPVSDAIPPDGRITAPANGSIISAGTGTVSIRAEAWDNPGGSGVDRVRFFVEYDGLRRQVCTDTDANPSCAWSIPAGLAPQQLVFTIDVVDRAGNIRQKAGGPVSVTYQGSGDATPPDGRITSPTNGSRIGPDMTSVAIRAEAWDNPGGSGMDRVRFFVTYNNEPVHVCTDMDDLPSCQWTIPAGLASQQLVFTIDVLDRAGNIRHSAGGPIVVTYQPAPSPTPMPPPDYRGSLHIFAPSFYESDQPVAFSAKVENPTNRSNTYTVDVLLRRDGNTVASQTRTVSVPGGSYVRLDINLGIQPAGSYSARAELKLGAASLQTRLFTVRVLAPLSSSQSLAILYGGFLTHSAYGELEDIVKLVVNRYGDSVSNLTVEGLGFLTGKVVEVLRPVARAIGGFSSEQLNKAIGEVTPRILDIFDMRATTKGAVMSRAEPLVDDSLAPERRSIGIRQEAFRAFVVGRGDFKWSSALSDLAIRYKDVIRSRVESEPVIGFGLPTQFLIRRDSTLEKQDQVFGFFYRFSDLLGKVIFFAALAVLLLAGLALALGISIETLFGSVAVYIAAIPGLISALSAAKLVLIATGLVLFAIVMHVQAMAWVAPSVTREHDRALDTLSQRIQVSTGVSLEELATHATIRGREITLSTNLVNSDERPAQPLVETYLYSVDGRIVKILSRQPAMQAHSTETWRDTITLLPGRYTAVTAVHTRDEIGKASHVASLEVPGPEVALGVSLDKTQASLGQSIQATVVLTNTSATMETGDLTLFIQFGASQDFESWLLNLAPAGSKHLTYNFTPEATGSGRLRVSVTNGTGLLATQDAAYIVGSGASMAVNIGARAVYSPNLAVTFPITAANVGNLPTSTVLSLVTLDNRSDSTPIFTDTLSLNLAANAEAHTSATALPDALSRPGSYTAQFFLGSDIYQSLDFAVAAEDTLFASITPERIFSDVGDSVPLTVTVMNSAFALADASVEVSIWGPDGATYTLAMSHIGNGLYRGMATVPISGTYLAAVEVSKPKHQVVGSSIVFIAGEMSQLQPTVEGHPVLAATKPVTFTVRNEHGAPIVGAQVVISGTDEYYSSPTDQMGRAVIWLSPLNSDRYQAVLEKPGFADTLMDVPVWVVPRVYLPIILRNR